MQIQQIIQYLINIKYWLSYNHKITNTYHMPATFNICANNYLARANTLAVSNKKDQPNHNYIIAILDKRNVYINYADGGFSSLHGDPVFKKNKKLLFLRRSFGQVSIKFLLKIMLPKLLHKVGRIFSIVKGFMNVDLFKTKNT